MIAISYVKVIGDLGNNYDNDDIITIMIFLAQKNRTSVHSIKQNTMMRPGQLKIGRLGTCLSNSISFNSGAIFGNLV